MKKLNSLAILIVNIFMLSACGGDDSSDTGNTKDLFSLWYRTTDNAPFDFRGGAFSTNIPMAFFFTGGEQCDCDLVILGTQSSGTYVLNSCVYVFGSGSSDPGCNALNQTGTYTNSNNTLTLAGPNGTTTLH